MAISHSVLGSVLFLDLTCITKDDSEPQVHYVKVNSQTAGLIQSSGNIKCWGFFVCVFFFLL